MFKFLVVQRLWRKHSKA